MGKERYNENNIFDKERYKPIFALIFYFQDKKIRFFHLKYYLVENNNINDEFTINRINSFFKHKEEQKIIDKFREGYSKKLLSYDDYVKGIEILKQSFETKLKIRGLLIDDKKFLSEQGLRNAITRIKKIGIIESVKSKKGYPHYKFTDKGYILYLCWQVHNMIDLFLKDDLAALLELQFHITNRATEKLEKDRSEKEIKF